jgi:hypothetical protein
MTKGDLISYLVPLLKERVLEPEAAIAAAWEHGFKEADKTHDQRRQQQNLALQMRGMQGK